MNPQDEQHAALLQRYDLVSKLLTAEPVKNEKLDEFSTLLDNDFTDFANEESSLAEEAAAMNKLRIVESRLEEVVAFPHIFTKTSIAIGGGFSAGKSEFVNSFITESDISLPVAIQPATAIPSFVVAAADSSVTGFSRNKGAVDIPSALYNRLTHDFIDTFSFNIKDIMPSMTVKVPLRAGLFENICLIDTPGYNPAGGNTDSDREMASDFLRDRDALIWMIGLDATGTIPQSDLEFLDDMELDGLPLYVVLSKADTKSPSDLADILAEVQGTLEDEDIGYVGISAYSSIQKEEYPFEGVSLEEFLCEQNRHNGRLEAILGDEIKGVCKMYSDALRKDSVAAERLKERLDDLSYKVQEIVGDAGDKHDELDETIAWIKRAQRDKVEQFKQQMEQVEQLRKKMFGAMEAVFRSLGVSEGEEYVDSAERQRQEQVFVEQVGRLPSLDPRIVDKEGKTDLHIAAELNLSVLILSLLKDNPASSLFLQVKDKKESTLLHYVAGKNASETAEVLLEYGADVDAKDGNGQTPLHLAAERDASQTAEVLLSHGAQTTATATVVNSDGDKVLDGTPLHFAAMCNASQTAEVLLQHGANVHEKNENDQTPLHHAVMCNSPQAAEVLLQHGANVHEKNENGQTPLHYAAMCNSPQAAEVLLQHGANVHEKNENDYKKTPLHYAAICNALETATLLVSYGADVNVKDRGVFLNETPLNYAKQKNAQEVAAFLESCQRVKPAAQKKDALEKSPLLERVTELVVEQLGVSKDQVNPQASFIDDLGADSLDAVELVMAFEDEFGIDIADEDAEKIVVVADAIKYLEEHSKA